MTGETSLHNAAKPIRLRNYTPLRYPGGKGKLAAYLKAIVKANGLMDGEYVEPYAGGAAIALELLFHEYVERVHINDVSAPVYAFWHSVLTRTDEFCRLVMDTPRSVEQWDVQKGILRRGADGDDLRLGFAFFYLNRTNRSGIVNAGIIGGRAQTGPWKIDARYNAQELVARIQAIARLSDRINLTNEDAVAFLQAGRSRWPPKTLIYCDPPYYVKGHELYLNFYRHADHLQVAEAVKSISEQKWVVSYDNVPEIAEMYQGFREIVYDIGYSARSARQGSELMFFGPGLRVPDLVGPVVLTPRVPALV